MMSVVAVATCPVFSAKNKFFPDMVTWGAEMLLESGRSTSNLWRGSTALIHPEASTIQHTSVPRPTLRIN